ncbi:proline dehydrogenase family protein [Terrihalobacillus insolitus]|uniref:proline dehydrogenase family protein n=1 Tax=Terrihalobacillus insolitus TaxID=2950438 RepID=UPI00233F8B0E|nr:proline dehydrogenase family protein [Terrihalobacillus insolitus]MDC3414779.1 proline dehydrogenase family protein [Terrihalobacillus insolitus]
MILKNFFIGLSQNQFLNTMAQKYGFKLGAKSVVAGTNVEEMIESVKELNMHGISCTIDNLGEFVYEREEATKAKEQIINVIEAINGSGVDAHISLKPTQLGLDIDYDFCLRNLEEIVGRAHSYNIFINFDMEDYGHLQPSLDLIDELSKKYENIGTVIQAYFFRAEQDIQRYRGYRLRLVKGAYKEPEEVAYQDKKEIDRNLLRLIEYHLVNGKFTSIATHDHNIINHVKKFTIENNIPKEKFEFQMLYGFRKEMQLDLAKEGYNFCTYVPFGTDWYGYFMRRLAERPQNLNLIAKQVFNRKTNTIIGFGVGTFFLGRLTKK